MPIMDRVYQCEFRGLVCKIMELADLDVEWECMQLAKNEHKPGQFVAWIPKETTPFPDDQPQPISYEGNQVDFLYSEGLRVEAHIYGQGEDSFAGYEDAEWIRRNILVAAHRTFLQYRPRSEIGGSEPVNQNDGRAAHALGGREFVIQQFTFHQPIPKRITQQVTLLDAPVGPHECELLAATATDQEFIDALIPPS